MVCENNVIIVLTLTEQLLHGVPVHEDVQCAGIVYHIRHGEGIVHIIHLILQHQNIAFAHAKLLRSGAGDHRLTLFGADCHVKIGVARVDAQHRHFQIIAIGFLFQRLSIGRGAALRHFFGGIFVGIAVFIGGLGNAAQIEVVAQMVGVHADHQHQQTDEHAAQHREGRAQLPQQLPQLEPGQEAHAAQVDAGNAAGTSRFLFTAQQRQGGAAQLLADDDAVDCSGHHRRHHQRISHQPARQLHTQRRQRIIADGVLHLLRTADGRQAEQQAADAAQPRNKHRCRQIMRQQLVPGDAQRIQCANDAALLLNVVHHEHRDDIGEQDHQDHACRVAGVAVNFHVTRRTVDAGVVGGRQELGQVVKINTEIFIQQFIGSVLEFLHAVPQLRRTIPGRCHRVGVFPDAAPEVCNLAKCALRFRERRAQGSVHSAVFACERGQLGGKIFPGQGHVQPTGSQLFIHQRQHSVSYGICPGSKSASGLIQRRQSFGQLPAAGCRCICPRSVGTDAVPECCHCIQLGADVCKGRSHSGQCGAAGRRVQLVCVIFCRQAKTHPIAGELRICHGQNGVKDLVCRSVKGCTVGRKLCQPAGQCTAALCGLAHAGGVLLHTLPELFQRGQFFRRLPQGLFQRRRSPGSTAQSLQLSSIVFRGQLHRHSRLCKAVLRLRQHGVQKGVRRIVQLGVMACQLIHAVGQLSAAVSKGRQRVLQVCFGLLCLRQIVQKIGVGHLAAIQCKGLQQSFQAVIRCVTAQAVCIGVVLRPEGLPGSIQRVVVFCTDKPHTKLFRVRRRTGSFFKHSIVVRCAADASYRKGFPADRHAAAKDKLMSSGVVLFQQDLAGLHAVRALCGNEQVNGLPVPVDAHGGTVHLKIQRKIFLQGHTFCFDLRNFFACQRHEHAELAVLHTVSFVTACRALNDRIRSTHQGYHHEHGQQHQKEQRRIPRQVSPDVPQDPAGENFLHLTNPPAVRRACGRHCGSSCGSGRPSGSPPDAPCS